MTNRRRVVLVVTSILAIAVFAGRTQVIARGELKKEAVPFGNLQTIAEIEDWFDSQCEVYGIAEDASQFRTEQQKERVGSYGRIVAKLVQECPLNIACAAVVFFGRLVRMTYGKREVLGTPVDCDIYQTYYHICEVVSKREWQGERSHASWLTGRPIVRYLSLAQIEESVAKLQQPTPDEDAEIPDRYLITSPVKAFGSEEEVFKCCGCGKIVKDLRNDGIQINDMLSRSTWLATNIAESLKYAKQPLDCWLDNSGCCPVCARHSKRARTLYLVVKFSDTGNEARVAVNEEKLLMLWALCNNTEIKRRAVLGRSCWPFAEPVTIFQCKDELNRLVDDIKSALKRKHLTGRR